MIPRLRNFPLIDIRTDADPLSGLGRRLGRQGRPVVQEITTYCVPGNAIQAKGRPAIWLCRSKARKPMIIFADLVLQGG